MVFVSCSSKQNTGIFLFNGISFKLNGGEGVVTIDSKEKETFNSFFNKKTNQIPLFRCIKGDSYMLYIGLPFNTSVKELAAYRMAQGFNQTFSESDSTKYFYKTYSNENEHLAIYTKNFGNNLVYVLTASNSAELSDSLFNMKSLSSRFTH